MPEATERPQNGACSISTSRPANGVVSVAVSGELDLYTAPQLEQALAVAAEDGARGLLVDLAECEFIDSTALGALLDAHRRLGAGDRRLTVVAPDPQIRRVFELTGLDRVLTLHASQADALAAAGA